MKKTKRFVEGGRGRSAYQGNEDSYTQASDPDASESVDKGALSRRLAASAAARDMETSSPRASRDFDSDMGDVNYSAPSRMRSDSNAIANAEESAKRTMPTPVSYTHLTLPTNREV